MTDKEEVEYETKVGKLRELRGLIRGNEKNPQ